MTFLNPFMLFGLLAASVPLLIHLLNLRKLRTVDFSSLRFLKELQRSSIRRVKIRQWLLLAIRTAMIVALVVAFARPALHGSFAGLLGGRAATAMVLIIDDSPSTAARNERGVIFPQIREAASEIGKLLRAGDRLVVMRLSDVGRRDDFPPLGNPDDLPKILSTIEPAQVRGSFHQALKKAAEVLAKTTEANRELYLVTDAQANQFAPGSSADDSIPFLSGVHAFVVHAGPAQGLNGAVESGGSITRVVTKSRPIDIQATIHVPGSGGSLSTMASVYLAGTRVAQQSVDLPAGEATTIHARVVPRLAGVLPGYVQIDDDALESDNRRYFTVSVPRRINVFLCGNSPADLRFVRLALTLGGDTTVAGLFSLRSGDEQDLSSSDLSSEDVVCLSNVPRLSTASAEGLARFVRSGGGLVLFIGGNVDIANYDEALLPRLGLPPATAPPAISTPAVAVGGQSLSLRQVDFDHPLFEGMFDESPGIRKGIMEGPAVLKATSIAVGPTGRSIIRLSNQQPFLAEFSSGEGRILVFAVDAVGAWSNFPTSALFAPLLYRSMIYLGDAGTTFASVTVGAPIDISLRLRTQESRSAFAFFSPSGQAEKVVPAFSPATGAATFTSRPTTETGVYKLFRISSEALTEGQLPPGDPIATVAVNADTAESDLRQADRPTMESCFVRAGVAPNEFRDLAVGESPATVIEESRYGIELWRLFVGAALLLGLLELALGNTLRRAETIREERPDTLPHGQNPG